MSNNIEYEQQLQEENDKLREILDGILNEIDEKTKRVEEYKKKYGELSSHGVDGLTPTWKIAGGVTEP